MRIDLREIKTYVITTNPVRAAFVKAQLAKVGITPEFVEGVKASPKVLGCGLSHLKVLRSNPKPPFLILEDDVAVTDDFRPILEFTNPSEEPSPHLVYLGVSTWGIIKNLPIGLPNTARATRLSDLWIKPHNMLSSHAILYLTHLYVQVGDVILGRILEGKPFDTALAEMQHSEDDNHSIIAAAHPFFYQSAEVGGAEDATRNPLNTHQ